MPTITCVGSSQPALYVIICSETAPGRGFHLLNQIPSITFIVLLLHKSEKAKFVVQPEVFFFLSLPFLFRQANDFLLLIHPRKWFRGAKKPTPSSLQQQTGTGILQRC